MDTQPTYALSSRTPRWALDPYRFPGLVGLDVDEAHPDAVAPTSGIHEPWITAGTRRGRWTVATVARAGSPASASPGS
ncbi:hypothetical protein [Streptomyces sp. NBC_01276]|uniref:hypothetical protein n=1 Tax=Streptomyces sp. NBC_01276 TaxID=2903808 RepID=UPI00352F6D95